MDAIKSWTPLAPGTALPLDRPLVFLESTVIAQGLPWPENLETALAMEAAVQASGAVPAMIAVLDGVVCLGLSAAEIEAVARSAETPKQRSQPGLPTTTKIRRARSARRIDATLRRCLRRRGRAVQQRPGMRC
jgi:pseudouridine-5'-phosphate glycosidase